MANVTRTIAPSQIKFKPYLSPWEGWQTYSSSMDVEASYGNAWMLRFDLTAVHINALSLSFRISSRADFNRITFTVYGDEDGTSFIDANSIDQFPTTGAVDATVSFDALPKDAAGLYILIQGSSSVSSHIYSLNATVTYEQAALTVSPSPATVYDIESSGSGYTNMVTLTFGNRIGQTLHVQFKYNSTVVREYYNIDEDSYSENMAGFFTEAGATGSSITVRVDVSDELGRTANASFTLIKPQGSTATPTAPKNTTLDGTLPINFAWSMSSGYGDQTKAELQYSTDNAAWTNLATVNGDTQTWTAPKLTFPGGTIYWRVRVTNDFGIVGPWSSSVSFTARYDAVSQVYPVNSQTSGNFSRTSDMQFQVGLETTGQVPTPFTIASAVFHWRAGTSGEWTDVAMTRADSNLTASVTIPANTFPSGQVQWYAEATDNTGRTTETEVYTLTALVASVQAIPIRPINTVENGNGNIELYWSYASADGSTQNGVRVQLKQAELEDWVTETFYIADWGDLDKIIYPPDSFYAGEVQWRVAAQNSAGVWSPYSDIVSFTVLDAPTVEGVTGDGKPFLTITWQTPTDSDYGQQAYKIEVDGKLYGPYFGANVRSYTLKEPLEDGPHTVRVAAQNRFSLWSEWAEGNVVVTNDRGVLFNVAAQATESYPAALIIMYTPPMAPIITRQPQDYRSTNGTARFSVSYKMHGDMPIPGAYGLTVSWEYRTGPNAAWQPCTGATVAGTVIVNDAVNGYQYRAKLSNSAGEIYSEPATFYSGEPAGYASDLKEGEWKAPTGYFLIYRNGELIANTYNNYFTDSYVIGAASYDVIQVLPNGYYTRGTVVSGYESVTVTADVPTIIPLGTTNYIPVCYSDDAAQEITITRRRHVQQVYYSGAKYPAVEMSEHEELSASFPTFWVDGEDANADALEALVGKPVMLKTPKGRRLVGVLDSLPGVDASWRRAYTVTLTQMEWEDYRDES